MSDFIHEIAGWSGAATYIVAYLLLSLGKLSIKKITYHLMNAAGGALICINAFLISDYSVFVLNFLWMLIALYSLVKIKTNNRKVQEGSI
jgi:hypothetical protein